MAGLAGRGRGDRTKRVEQETLGDVGRNELGVGVGPARGDGGAHGKIGV